MRNDGLNLPEGLHTLQLTFHNIGALSSTIDIPLELKAPIQSPTDIRSNQMLRVRRLIPAIQGIQLEVQGSFYAMNRSPTAVDLFEIELSSLPLIFPENVEEPVLEALLHLFFEDSSQPTPLPRRMLIFPPLADYEGLGPVIRDSRGQTPAKIRRNESYKIWGHIASRMEPLTSLRLVIGFTDGFGQSSFVSLGTLTLWAPQFEIDATFTIPGWQLTELLSREGTSGHYFILFGTTASGQEVRPEGGQSLVPQAAATKPFPEALKEAVDKFVGKGYPFEMGGKEAADRLEQKHKQGKNEKGVDCSGFVWQVINEARLSSGKSGVGDLIAGRKKDPAERNHYNWDTSDMLDNRVTSEVDPNNPGNPRFSDLKPGDMLVAKYDGSRHSKVIEDVYEDEDGNLIVDFAQSGQRRPELVNGQVVDNDAGGPVRGRVVVPADKKDSARLRDAEAPESGIRVGIADEDGVLHDSDYLKDKITENGHARRIRDDS